MQSGRQQQVSEGRPQAGRRGSAITAISPELVRSPVRRRGKESPGCAQHMGTLPSGACHHSHHGALAGVEP